ncbi:MAG: branched-chain amino acid ABC transporter permease [Burkholderiaceae bacterium]|jgi:branched-chain amino acid transport system permease protein
MGQNSYPKLTFVVLLLLAVVPPLLYVSGNPFYLDLATRLTILATAAVALNLVLGYGGLVSFGHAAYVGIGAYAVGIPGYHALYGGLESLGLATHSGFVHLALAMGISAVFAFLTGLVCLRTKGVYFIMITMAFAQMIYYAIVSIKTYGGDDGLTIDVRSEFPGISLDNPLQLFAVSYGVLLFAIVVVRTLVNSRFGMVLQGAKGNNERVIMLGYNTYAYRLTAYVISGALAGLAGALLGNFTTFISPEMMDWTRSGDLMFMVILGGVATTIGPVLGSVVFIVIEEILSSFTVYWQLPFGLLLMAVVLYGRGGLVGFFKSRSAPTKSESKP